METHGEFSNRRKHATVSAVSRHAGVHSRYPVLTVGMALTKPSADVRNGIRYERAWVCRNEGSDYRELVGDA